LWSILLLLVPLLPLSSTLFLQLLQLRLLFRRENPVQLRHGVLMQFLHLGVLLILSQARILPDRLSLRSRLLEDGLDLCLLIGSQVQLLSQLLHALATMMCLRCRILLAGIRGVLREHGYSDRQCSCPPARHCG